MGYAKTEKKPQKIGRVNVVYNKEGSEQRNLPIDHWNERIGSKKQRLQQLDESRCVETEGVGSEGQSLMSDSKVCGWSFLQKLSNRWGDSWIKRLVMDGAAERINPQLYDQMQWRGTEIEEIVILSSVTKLQKSGERALQNLRKPAQWA